MQFKDITRRGLFGIGAGALATATSGSALAQAKSKPIKVASIYTVPVEQQWVSRIHKALNSAKDRGDVTYKWSENVANNDYERIMRQYAEEGNDSLSVRSSGSNAPRAGWQRATRRWRS